MIRSSSRVRTALGALLALGVLNALQAQASDSPDSLPSEEALTRYARGRLLEERGLPREALAEYYRALSLDPRAIAPALRVSELHARTGEAERSLEFAERVVGLDSTEARGHGLKGAALLNLGRTRESLDPLLRATRLDPDRPEYFRALGRAAEALERPALTAATYRHLVQLDEEDPEAWFQLALAETRRGRYASADSAVKVSVALNPLRPGSLFLRGWIAEGLDRSEEAISWYRHHLEVHEDDRQMRRRLAVLLIREKRHAEALHEIRRLIRAEPQDLETRQLEADLAFQAGRPSEGEEVLRRLRRERPDDPEVIAAQVALLARNGRVREGAAVADQWLEKHPSDMRAMLIAARAQQLNGDSTRALDLLERAAETAPDSVVVHVMRARALQDAGRLADAEKVWSRATLQFPEEHGLRYDLALCRERLGDLAGAESAVRDVLAREPDNPVALNFLGYLFADHSRKLPEAVELIQRALQLDPDNFAYLDSLGWAYYRLGRLDEARTLLERAVGLGGRDPVIHEHLGDVYKDLKLNHLARDQYQRCLAGDAGNSRVQSKLRDLPPSPTRDVR